MFKAIFVAAALLFAVVAAQNADQITGLPGYSGSIPFKQYGGYLMSNSTNRRYLYYWFVESQNNPSKDPVLLWLNGGPGCSSLTGESSENGPFLVNADGETLTMNPNSWNKVANVIFLESPAGVGYSYSETPSDYKNVGDDKTAFDNYQALVQFFQKYPQYANNDFYISGESYAGRYIPLLVNQIYENNKHASQKINLKGFLIGNGCFDMKIDANTIPLYLQEHSICPNDDYQKAVKQCNGDFYTNQDKPGCAAALNVVTNYLNGLNPYYLYDECPVSPISKLQQQKPTYVNGKRIHPLFTMFTRRMSYLGKVGLNDPTPQRCVPDSAMTNYFNRADVKQALHARSPNNWDVCNFEINANYQWQYDSMIPFFQKLLPVYRSVFYSGDVDAVVNSMGTQLGIEALNMTVTQQWNAWTTEDGIAGYCKKWSLTQMCTIRGAGHMVPSQRPRQSLALLSRFFSGKL